MKKALIFYIICSVLVACNQSTGSNDKITEGPLAEIIDTTDMTNNFYDNSETYSLPVKELTVEGEISNPGKVDFSKLPLRSVVVKETLLDSSGSDKFKGAFRYDGYSLFDILNERKLNKANAEEFSPIIDLYVEVINDKGEKSVFSWGEIYYPNSLHRIILATRISRIVPSKTGDLWDLPSESKIVAGNDLITERNISSPVRIIVKSFPRSFSVNRGMSPLYSDKISLFEKEKEAGELSEVPAQLSELTYNTIFYGRGKGIHSTEPFTGLLLKDLLSEYYSFTGENLREGIMCIAGKDGYRCAMSYSELFNRNDQQEFLLVETEKNEDGGLFRLFPAGDFFSDRAVKAIEGIYLVCPN